MKKSFLNLEGVEVLTKLEQKNTFGGLTELSDSDNWGPNKGFGKGDGAAILCYNHCVQYASQGWRCINLSNGWICSHP